jgi:hypothetical protein
MSYVAFRRRVAEGEVDKVVLMDNMSKAYIAMKEGFPDEYVVDLPMDPYLPQFLDSFSVSCCSCAFFHVLWPSWAFIARLFVSRSLK